ncbi:hypothetical protein NQ314_006723 [Rhamnusium bicolor]|uniref:C2H2-type domain-containing protein n=1 Tax=Rhamnusium bicolor TaxID=1586634 RepID=A0AAV8YXM0_9CUCU|nr:hypothetical protein NQ314_006723 [Rhamnusium bicolor]
MSYYKPRLLQCREDEAILLQEETLIVVHKVGEILRGVEVEAEVDILEVEGFLHHFQVPWIREALLIQETNILAHQIDSYSGRDGSGRRSPDRKRMRLEAPSSRHDSSYGGYGPSRHESSYSDRRTYSGDRHSASTAFSRRDEFRRPTGPPPSRGSYRGRLSSRGSRGLRLRDRPTRRRLVESSYAVRKRVIPARSSDYARRLKISRMRSAIARKASKRRISEKEDSDDEKNKEKKVKDSEIKDTEDKEVSEKTPKREKDTEDKDNKSESGDEKLKKKTFIKLNCPHCGIKAVTFRKYDIHLTSKTHTIAMRKIALKQKSILAQMRQAQRNTQNELEKNNDDLTSKTNFCPLCKLNYKQKKAVHQLSEAHKNMKKKQRMEDCGSDISAEEDNLENFTTIDSVGDGDADGSENEEKKEEVKEPVNVGIEQVHKVEAHYCDLCKMYLPRGEEMDMPKILSRHCKLRVHMQRYVRYKEDKDLEKRAEKLQRKEIAEKEVKVKKEKDDKENVTESADNSDTKELKGEETTKCADDEEARDDKLWADVDKDLGDILAEAESGNKSSDEDEDSHVNGERYDRFKLSEKNGDEKLKKADEDDKLDKDVVEVVVEKKMK